MPMSIFLLDAPMSGDTAMYYIENACASLHPRKSDFE
jgi:hypothetical protein